MAVMRMMMIVFVVVMRLFEDFNLAPSSEYQSVFTITIVIGFVTVSTGNTGDTGYLHHFIASRNYFQSPSAPTVPSTGTARVQKLIPKSGFKSRTRLEFLGAKFRGLICKN